VYDSGGHVNFNDLQSTASFSSVRAYNQSKLCNVLFTLQLQNMMKGKRLDILNKTPANNLLSAIEFDTL
jgi:hypothetical protein